MKLPPQPVFNKSEVSLSSPSSYDSPPQDDGSAAVFPVPSSSPFANDDAPVLWTLTALYTVNLLAVLVANFITLMQLIAKRSKRINFVTNPYVCCLLFADVLWPAINLPFNVVQTWTPYWLFGRVTCKLFPVVQMCFPDAISLTLCLIAIERYFAVIHPFKTNPLLKRPVAIVSIAVIWLIPLTLNLMLAITHDLFDLTGDETEGEDDNADSSSTSAPQLKTYACGVVEDSFVSSRFVDTFKIVQSTVVLLIIPGILFPFCYGQIVLKVFAMKTSAQQSSLLAQSLDDNNNKNLGTSGANSNKKRLAKLKALTNKRLTRADRRRRSVTLLSIVIQVVHFTCWTPIVVFQLIHFARDYPPLSSTELICLRFFVLLASTNPALNSLLYTAALYREVNNHRHSVRRKSKRPPLGTTSLMSTTNCIDQPNNLTPTAMIGDEATTNFGDDDDSDEGDGDGDTLMTNNGEPSPAPTSLGTTFIFARLNKVSPRSFLTKFRQKFGRGSRDTTASLSSNSNNNSPRHKSPSPAKVNNIGGAAAVVASSKSKNGPHPYLQRKLTNGVIPILPDESVVSVAITADLERKVLASHRRRKLTMETSLDLTGKSGSYYHNNNGSAVNNGGNKPAINDFLANNHNNHLHHHLPIRV